MLIYILLAECLTIFIKEDNVYKKISLILIIWSLLFSCDKPRSIRLCNNLTSNVAVTFNYWEDSANVKNSVLLNPKQSILIFVRGENGNIFGTWSNEDVIKHSKSIKSFVVIVNAKGTIRIDSTDRLSLLLQSKKVYV